MGRERVEEGGKERRGWRRKEWKGEGVGGKKRWSEEKKKRHFEIYTEFVSLLRGREETRIDSKRC